ncbi:shikimate kinase [uncultured Flavobacterium sp.]|jgi:shikimate kinase|uniref:shikimate kinase n=1 Tax=uncultured Flavobacterium sp. TaxID=165435 RepID=UPI0030CA3A2D
MRKIILLGYMGSGKSTVANRLSKITNIPSVDLDKCIEERTKSSINEIFEQQGEIYFRKLEREVLVELLDSPGNLIISLGGGAPCYANNHELLKGENVVSIYLKASVETLFERLVSNKSKRPIIANMNEDEMREFIAKHLFERSFYYNQAQYKVSVDAITKDEAAQKIFEILT